MSRKIVFGFGGQGGQQHGMARNLLNSDAVFRRAANDMDRILKVELGVSVIDEVFRSERPVAEALLDVRLSHPATFVAQVALLESLRERGVRPDYVFGASLGEIVAMVAAGVVARSEALRAVIEQVRCLEAAGCGGGMLALLGSAAELAEDVCARSGAELAGVSSVDHFVVSGSEAAIEAAERWAASRAIARVRLPVRHGFHSSAIDAAASRCLTELAKIRCSRPAVPIVSCVSGRFRDGYDGADLWRVVRDPMRLQDAIGAIEAVVPGALYLDASPSGALANAIKRCVEEGVERVQTIFQPPGGSMDRLNDVVVRHGSSATSGAGNAVMFPGQGSQSRGMGKALFERYPEETRAADEILGYSIEELCSVDAAGRLNETQFTQPALFVVNALTYLDWRGKNAEPMAVVGHSLGEYNALVAAGVFDFRTGLRLVQKRGELMARERGGGMAAVVGLAEATVRAVLLGPASELGLDLANLNAPDQYVVAGPAAAVSAARALFEVAGARAYVPLNVSGAFHSRHMQRAASEFAEFLKEFEFSAPTIPVVSNAEAAPYVGGRVAELLARQLTSPVRWIECIRHLGARASNFIECGNGNVLMKLVNKIKASGALAVEPEADARSVRGGREAAVAPPRADARSVALDGATESRSLSSSSGNVIELVREPRPAREEPPGGRPIALGSDSFRTDYGAAQAYAVVGTSLGVLSPELVARCARRGVLAFHGAGAVELERVARAVISLKEAWARLPLGLGITWQPRDPEVETAILRLALEHGVQALALAGYVQATPGLVQYRALGLDVRPDGTLERRHKILAKVSRADVAAAFMKPPPGAIVSDLLARGDITARQADLAQRVPLVDDVAVDSNAGGASELGTDQALFSRLLALRDRLVMHEGATGVRVGYGEVGDPVGIAMAFFAGADFVHADSIHQCTAEAELSAGAKDLLAQASVHDTESVPASETFVLGGRVRALKRGTLFPVRSNRLYELYRRHASLAEVPAEERRQLEERVLRRSFADLLRESEASPLARSNDLATLCEGYLSQAARNAGANDALGTLDVQVRVGPSLGAFNAWARGTSLERWQERHADDIALVLLAHAAEFLAGRLPAFSRVGASAPLTAAGARSGAR